MARKRREIAPDDEQANSSLQQHDNPQQSSRRLDHGRSWFVLFSVFLTCVSMGSVLALGTLYEIVAHHVGTASGEVPSKVELTMLFTVIIGISCITGVVAAVVTAAIGYRLTMAIGTFIAITGFGLSALAIRVWHLYLTLGILVGIGFGLCFTPAIGLMEQYFSERYFNLASSIASTGTVVGLMIYSYVHQILFERLAWHAAMLIEAVLCLPLLVCPLIIRKPDVQSAKVEPVIIELSPTNSNRVDHTTEDGTFAFDNKSLNPNSVQLPTGRQHRALSHPAISSFSSEQSPQQRFRAYSTRENRATNCKVSASLKNHHIMCVVRQPIATTAENEIEIEKALQKRSRKFLAGMLFRSKSYNKPAVRATGKSTKAPFRQLLHSELFRNGAFYLLMIQCTAVLANDFFVTLTPAYLTDTQGWQSANAANIISIYGMAGIVSRLMVVLLNIRPSLAARVPKVLQVGFGIVLNCSAALVYLLAAPPPALHVRVVKQVSMLQERNAWLFIIFSATCSFGESCIWAYQAALLHEILPHDALTASFGYECVVLGIIILVLGPVAGVFGDAFGTLKYAYAICLIFCAAGFTALIGVVVLVKVVRVRKQSRAH